MKFTIPAPLHSYHEIRSTGRRGKGTKSWVRTTGYKRSQQTIRLIANVARIPDTIAKNEYARIEMEIFWVGLARLDLANVQKWVEDALFTEDRRIQEMHVKMHEHSGREYAEVRVDIYPAPRRRMKSNGSKKRVDKRAGLPGHSRHKRTTHGSV